MAAGVKTRGELDAVQQQLVDARSAEQVIIKMINPKNNYESYNIASKMNLGTPVSRSSSKFSLAGSIVIENRVIFVGDFSY